MVGLVISYQLSVGLLDVSFQFTDYCFLFTGRLVVPLATLKKASPHTPHPTSPHPTPKFMRIETLKSGLIVSCQAQWSHLCTIL
ncbi:MAG UNVERIFIED_CONTAM: hypothetical protein LVR29_23335 [Microcystis novacekii LVE1205-3]